MAVVLWVVFGSASQISFLHDSLLKVYGVDGCCVLCVYVEIISLQVNKTQLLHLNQR